MLEKEKNKQIENEIENEKLLKKPFLSANLSPPEKEQIST